MDSGVNPAAPDVLVGGHRQFVRTDRRCVVGSATSADIVVADHRVADHHLVLEPTDDGWAAYNIGIAPTWLDGTLVQTVAVGPGHERRLRLGTPDGPEVVLTGPDDTSSALPTGALPAATLPSAAGAGLPTAGAAVPAQRARAATGGEHQLYIGTQSVGRARGSDIQLPDLLVSRRHAELRVERTTVDVVDLGSSTGTRLNGRRIDRARLRQGDVLSVGHYQLQLQGTVLVEVVDADDVSLEAYNLSVRVGRTPLLRDVGLRLPARRLLAVIGPSGAGKSTLIGALSGLRPVDSGSVRYAGRDLHAEYDELRLRIGYVPQQDLLHATLTVRKALEYGAELRFSPDVSRAERRLRVGAVLAELELTGVADLEVRRLSGGQRKRTSVALELLTKPSLLFLDEPTSGLDPGLEKSFLRSLRALADAGRTVVVVTHSVAQLDLCDLVLVLAEGGHVAFLGPPAAAPAYFGVTDLADVFLALGSRGGREWGDRWRAELTRRDSRPRPAEPADAGDLPSIRRQRTHWQLSTLSKRYLRVVAADRSYLRLALAFPLLLGIISRVIPAEHGLSVLPTAPNRYAQPILAVLLLSACFMGMAASVREIVKERAIFWRERGIGLPISAYVGSKIVVLALLSAPQAVIFTLIGVTGRTSDRSIVLGSPLAGILLAVVATTLVSAAVGLAVSVLVDDADKTMPLLVLVTMAQLVLSGGIVPIAGRPVIEQLSWLVPARWGFAAAASSTDLNAALKAGDPQFHTTADPLWRHSAWTYGGDLAALLLIGVASIALCAWLLRRDTGPRAAATGSGAHRRPDQAPPATRRRRT